jgi:hypothetical protein
VLHVLPISFFDLIALVIFGEEYKESALDPDERVSNNLCASKA